MCGIIGYIGGQRTTKVLLEGLKKLEYRGYDSCGLAINSQKGVYIKKTRGMVENLEKIVIDEEINDLGCGIAHTRWATHGIPSQDNAHPHTDCKGELVVVHNGIIENYLELRNELEQKGHIFSSQTDSEVIVHLIEEKLEALNKGATSTRSELLEPVFFEAFRRAINLLKGSFSLSVIWSRVPRMIMAARMHSPLIIGLGKNENFIASDVSAFLDFTRKVVFMHDGEIASVRLDKVDFFDFNGKRIQKEINTINWDSDMAKKGGYSHFMLKEIYEQPQSLEDTLRGRLLPIEPDLFEKEIKIKQEDIKNFSSINFVACGTAFHAGFVGKYIFEKLGIKTEVDLASEFEYRSKILDKNSLIIAISQSGETADTIYAVKMARKNGNKILVITNTLGSSLTRECDFVFYTHCGPETGVASTKAFMGQLAALYSLSLNFAYVRGKISAQENKKYVETLFTMPRFVENVLEMRESIENLTHAFSNKEHYLFIGRGINYPIALEGALKIKEISYVHAEGYAAGEMKHGPIAIIEDGMPVIAIALSGYSLPLMAGNIEEARARGGEIIAIVDSESRKIVKAKHYIEIPKVPEIFQPILSVIPLQLFSFYIALGRNCNIDKPRNLAKSVTVR